MYIQIFWCPILFPALIYIKFFFYEFPCSFPGWFSRLESYYFLWFGQIFVDWEVWVTCVFVPFTYEIVLSSKSRGAMLLRTGIHLSGVVITSPLIVCIDVLSCLSILFVCALLIQMSEQYSTVEYTRDKEFIVACLLPMLNRLMLAIMLWLLLTVYESDLFNTTPKTLGWRLFFISCPSKPHLFYGSQFYYLIGTMSLLFLTGLVTHREIFIVALSATQCHTQMISQ